MMKNLKLWSLLPFLALLVSGCLGDDSQDSHEALLEKEMEILNKYITDNNITVQPTDLGLYYIELEKGVGDSILLEDYVTINYVAYLLNGTMFDTNVDTMAIKGGIYNSSYNYVPYGFVVGEPSTILGVQHGVQFMREQGKARLIFPSTLGYGSYHIGPITPYSSLIFDIHLLTVQR